MKNDSQNFGKKDVKKFRKHIQNLQQEFNRRCSLISDLLNILHPKPSPKPLKPKANQEDIHLTPLQLIAVTNALAERLSWNPSVRRILTVKYPSEIRCYKCNKTGHTAKNCLNRKKFNFASNKSRHNLYTYQKRSSSGPNI